MNGCADAADQWLCGPGEFEGPCTPERPCLWDVVADPSERREVAAANPKVVEHPFNTVRVYFQCCPFNHSGNPGIQG